MADITVHHIVSFEGSPSQGEILARLISIEERQVASMATEAQLLALISEANTITTEIAEDIAEMLAKEPISPEALAAVTAHVEALRGVASVVPEPAPVEPPAEPTP